MTADQNDLAAGEIISHYKILSQLGIGGMGEVYLAEDTMLGRKVALKLLPADSTRDTDRVRRFQQEARAASALNHPNIVTIHEIAQIDDRHFIATEFIDGETLRQRIIAARSRTSESGGATSGTSLPIGEVLNIAIQTADALAAAHEVGIVHRDIKPENIMVRRRDGYVKVLDFGLAKLTQDPAVAVDTEAPTKTQVKTSAGLVMGTVMYMSPEQTRGEKVDPRTDIWSLGVVLYEMVAGFLPFEGANTNETVALILNDKGPPPLARYARDLPTELERIVTKALRKKRDERYQGVKDLLLDLKTLKQRLDFEFELEHSTPPAVRVEAWTGTGEAVRTKAESGATTAPSAKYIASGIRQHRGSFTVTLAALVLFVAFGLGYWFYNRSASTVTQINSIAVLPFTNESGNPDVEYLSDGMTESIINSLSQLPNMRVIARSTMFSFKGKARDPQTVGKQLSVDAVLMGRVVQRGESLTLQTDLVKVSDGSQIWGEHYNRKISDILAVQEDVSREIVSKLRIRLSGDQEQRVAKRYTENTEAYQLYLLGRFHWNKFTEEGVRKSIDYFNQALAKDPNYALAYHGLSDAYQVIGQIGFRPNEVLPKAIVYADKALAADPTLAEAHLSRGACELWYGWNWTMAEQELKRAMELNPNLADPHDLYGQFLSGMGRYDEAIAENKRALELDPLSRLRNANLAGVYYWARQYELAIGQSRKVTELDTNFISGPLIMGQAYSQQGKYPEAIAELIKTRDLPGGFTLATSELGYIYAVSGQRTKAQELLRELQERAKREFVDPYYIAIIHLGLGDQEQALAWLNRAYEERSYSLLWLNVEPKFERLRADPRYQDLLQRMNFPPHSV